MPERDTALEDLYLPSLDGLRFMAFCMVLLHHLPLYEASFVLSTLHAYGWIGVELFFVISSYLFFYLLEAERRKAGRISFSNFYLRRLLRIYPLMIAYPLLMIFIYGSAGNMGWYRLAGLALFADNFLAWFAGYNTSISSAAHLWTLSFEFQIYLAIPILYAAYVAFGRRTFTLLIVAVMLFCLVLRVVFFGMGAPHPTIWVTPFLRPESILLGILLSIYRPAWHWGYSAAGAVVISAAFLNIPVPWANAAANIVQYPLAAMLFSLTVDIALRGPLVRYLLGSRVVAGLGTISFGLYVFHIWALNLGDGILINHFDPKVTSHEAFRYVLLALLTLFISLGLAMASYFLLERPFLLFKRRFSQVDGRARIRGAGARTGEDDLH